MLIRLKTFIQNAYFMNIYVNLQINYYQIDKICKGGGSASILRVNINLNLTSLRNSNQYNYQLRMIYSFIWIYHIPITYFLNNWFASTLYHYRYIFVIFIIMYDTKYYWRHFSYEKLFKTIRRWKYCTSGSFKNCIPLSQSRVCKYTIILINCWI